MGEIKWQPLAIGRVQQFAQFKKLMAYRLLTKRKGKRHTYIIDYGYKGETTYSKIQLTVPPLVFKEAKDECLAIIKWASDESHHVPPKEFCDLLAGYLTAAHFAFITTESKLHHTFSELKGALTRRQNEIAHFVILGFTNKSISETIHVSQATIHHEVTRILKVFAVVNREELIMYFKKLESEEQEQEQEELTG